VQQNIPGNKVFSGVGLNNGVDIFSIMNQINTALRTNDRTAITNLLGQLDAAREQISSERSSVGGRINLLETIKTRQTDVQTNMQVLSSNLEDIDVAEAMTQLNKQQNIYEATLAAGAKIVQPSLLDFLR
jgi:flagellar hook-associated protein 3 FlgL